MGAKLKPADRLSGEITKGLGRAWAAIRRRHPDLPPAVVVLASGREGAALSKWGHWGESRWRVAGELAGEVLVAGELLAPGAGNTPGAPVEERVLEVLLHEAAHAIATARGIRDTSRGGRYHNARYKALAEEVGLTCEETMHGWALTELPRETAQKYSSELEALREVLRGYRHDDSPGRREKQKPTRVLAACGCDRRIYVARSVLEAGPITCGLCDEEFTAPEESESEES